MQRKKKRERKMMTLKVYEADEKPRKSIFSEREKSFYEPMGEQIAEAALWETEEVALFFYRGRKFCVSLSSLLSLSLWHGKKKFVTALFLSTYMVNKNLLCQKKRKMTSWIVLGQNHNK